MSPQRELDAPLIRFGRAVIDLQRVPLIPYAERDEESIALLCDATTEWAASLAVVTAVAVERALAGGRE
jgi:hypothetical protein